MTQRLKVVMAQLNMLVGDIDGNTQRIIAAAGQEIAEYSADLIVFPELALIGYPPEDLLLRPSLQIRIEKALEKILTADLQVTIVVGFPDLMSDRHVLSQMDYP